MSSYTCGSGSLIDEQVLANKLFPSDCWPVPFWIDSLCLPVTNHEARRIAIAEMERVYKGATRVLVLDSGLVTVSAHQHFTSDVAVDH